MFFILSVSLKLLLFNLSLKLFHLLTSFELLHFSFSEQLLPDNLCIKELFFSSTKFFGCFFQKQDVLVRLGQQLLIALYSVHFHFSHIIRLPLWSLNFFFQGSQNCWELKFIETVQVEFKCLNQTCPTTRLLLLDEILKIFRHIRLFLNYPRAPSLDDPVQFFIVFWQALFLVEGLIHELNFQVDCL